MTQKACLLKHPGPCFVSQPRCGLHSDLPPECVWCGRIAGTVAVVRVIDRPGSRLPARPRVHRHLLQPIQQDCCRRMILIHGNKLLVLDFSLIAQGVVLSRKS